MKYRQLFSEAQKKREIADVLAAQAMQPSMPQQGAVAAQYGIGHGLTDIAKALVARRAGKKADSSFADAESARSQALAQALAGMQGMSPDGMGPPTTGHDMYAPAQAAIEAGADPRLIAGQIGMQSTDRRRAEDRDFEREMFRSKAAEQTATSPLGQVPVGQYTPESIQAFQKSGDYGDLQRYERIRQITSGGVTYNVDSVTGENLGPVTSLEETAGNKQAISAASAEGSAEGKARSEARQELSKMEVFEGQLRQAMADPNFAGAVGPVDAITGRIGEMWGSEEGVLGSQVQRFASQLVTEAVSSWKGAISEKELDFFQKSVPHRSSSPETWQKWFQEEYLPRKARVQQIAGGSGPTAVRSGTVNGVSWSVEE